MNTNVKVIDLTRPGMKPEFTAPEAGAFTTRPFKLFNCPLRGFCDLATGIVELGDFFKNPATLKTSWPIVLSNL